jgi:hypothetical protein
MGDKNIEIIQYIAQLIFFIVVEVGRDGTGIQEKG